MRYINKCLPPAVVIAAFILAGTATQAQSWQPPTEAQRCSSQWGAGDQRGSANHMKPETVLRAMKLICAGEVIELGHPLSSSMPFYGSRRATAGQLTSRRCGQ